MTLNSRAGDRQLVQTKELAAAITALAAGHNHFFAPPRVDVTVSEAHFENMTFAAQRAAMRATDVLVASHGAGLTNVIFLRPAAAFAEWDAAVADGNTGPGRLRLERADNDGPVRRR
eukprot:contig_26167_g6441